jgi:hypothetical protein
MKGILDAIRKEKKALGKKLDALNYAEKALSGIKFKSASAVVEGPRTRSRMSASARRAIGAASKKRWAEWRKKNGKS